MSAPRITALRELAQEAELERRDFLYEATEQLRRFIDSNRERLREIGPVKLVDDDQDYLLFHPVDETWTTRLTYQDPADNEWYDEEQVIDSYAEIAELYNPADIFGWFLEAARDPANHLIPADELAAEEEVVRGRGDRGGLAGGPAADAAGDDRRPAAVAAGRCLPRPDQRPAEAGAARVRGQRGGRAGADRRPAAAG